jgi:hypothetical protein
MFGGCGPDHLIHASGSGSTSFFPLNLGHIDPVVDSRPFFIHSQSELVGDCV